MLDHRRLSYFLAVAAERSFTRAAERLHVAQPALSRQVRLLEEELGGPLLVRGGAEGVTPTPAGAVLLAQAPALLGELERIWEEAARVAGAERGGRVLRLGYAASAAHGSAPPILAELRERDAEIAVQARMSCTPDALEQLHAGNLDAAILRIPAGDAPGLEATLLRREVQGVIVNEAHPLDAGAPIPIAALRDATIVMHPRHANPSRHDAIVAACRAAGFDPAIEEPLLAFDPTHALIRGSDRVTIVSDPGPALPTGLRWYPLYPALALDVVLLTPIVAGAEPGVTATLRGAALAVAARLDWLREPTVEPPVPTVLPPVAEAA